MNGRGNDIDKKGKRSDGQNDSQRATPTIRHGDLRPLHGRVVLPRVRRRVFSVALVLVIGNASEGRSKKEAELELDVVFAPGTPGVHEARRLFLEWKRGRTAPMGGW